MLKAKWWCILAILVTSVALYAMERAGYPLWITIVSGCSIIITIVGLAIIQRQLTNFAAAEPQPSVVKRFTRLPAEQEKPMGITVHVVPYKVLKFLLFIVIMVLVYCLSEEYNWAWNSPTQAFISAILGAGIFYLLLCAGTGRFFSSLHFPYRYIIAGAIPALLIGIFTYLLVLAAWQLHLPRPHVAYTFGFGICSHAVIRSFIGDFEREFYLNRQDGLNSTNILKCAARVPKQFFGA